jgi:hypothetical protein
VARRIRNIATYVVFLAIGVFLFYLASLDITRGAQVIETPAATFEVGSGFGTCANGRSVRIASVAPELLGTAFTLRDEATQAVVVSDVFTAKTESPQLLCLPEGTYFFERSSTDAERAVVFEGVDKTGELVNDMRKASVPGILLSFLMGYLAIVSRGLRWLILLEPMGYKVSRWRSIHAVAFAYFANTFVPRSGELARCVALNQTDDVPVDRLFGTVISERVIDFVMLLGIMALAVLSNLDAFTRLLGGTNTTTSDADGGFTWWMVLAGAAVLGLVVFFGFRRSVLYGKIFNKVKAFISGVLEGLKSVLNIKRRAAFIFHTFFIWAMYFLMAYVIFMSIDGASSMTLSQALFVMVAGGFGMVIPAPGGIGSYHWMVKLAFIALGLSGSLGFVVANVMWLTQTVMIIIGGGIGYLLLMAFRIQRDRKKSTA